MDWTHADTWATAQGLVAALIVGLLIGAERGWRERDLAEGKRVAGVRTFSLVGLMGGAIGMLPTEWGVWGLASGIVGLSALMAVAFREVSRGSGNLSVTAAVSLLLTFVLGTLAARGAPGPALAAAVVAAVLLNLKPTLHRWLQQIEHREMTAALELLVLSVVILPNLPDAGFGPYHALNPYKLWWGVVLIAALSLAGDFAMRLTGAHRGVFWTGVLGGLASSTAATLTLSRLARREPALAGAAVAGVLASCGVMFLRMTVVLGVIQPALLRPLGIALAAAGVTLLAGAGWQWKRRAGQGDGTVQFEPIASFDLGTALGFGAYLAAMAVFIPAAREWLGSAGIYALSAVSGLADVDATTISLGRSYGTHELAQLTIVIAIGLTTLSNMVSKGVMAWSVGGAAVGRPVAIGYAAGIAVGASVLALA